MMFWNGEWSWGGWLAMTAAMVVVWALIAWVIVAAIRPADRPAGSTPEQVLAERLAGGEITAEEYEHLRDVLRG